MEFVAIQDLSDAEFRLILDLPNVIGDKSTLEQIAQYRERMFRPGSKPSRDLGKLENREGPREIHSKYI